MLTVEAVADVVTFGPTPGDIVCECVPVWHQQVQSSSRQQLRCQQQPGSRTARAAEQPSAPALSWDPWCQQTGPGAQTDMRPQPRAAEP